MPKIHEPRPIHKKGETDTENGRYYVEDGIWVEAGEPTPPPTYTFSATCENCEATILLEKSPDDWPNAPTGVRVAIECNACGARQYTEGATQEEAVKELINKITEDAMRAAGEKLGV